MFGRTISNGCHTAFANFICLPGSQLGKLQVARLAWQASCPRPVFKVTCSAKPHPTRRNVLQSIAIALASTVIPSWSLSSVSSSQSNAQTLSGTDREEAVRQLKRVTALQDEAFQLTNKGKFKLADSIWTEIIGLNEKNAAAWSNRGNCRTSQGRFSEAIQDFDRAIQLAPLEPDPHLGRGVALEGLRDYNSALEEYELANNAHINRYGLPDPVTYNNRGNVYGTGLGQWEKAVDLFHQAGNMSRQYIFPRANEALALYQLGKKNEARKMLETLLRKYPEFPDVRAALVAIYWTLKDRRSDAESYWSIVMDQDPRYKDMDWIRNIRRWPPLLAKQLNDFLNLTVTED